MNGQPCIRGMRLTVRRVLEAVALYADRAELGAEYPELEDQDIVQALDSPPAINPGVHSMNAILIEHVKITELPEDWRTKLAQLPGTTVTIRIEAETQGDAQTDEIPTDDALFGMWCDREDMADAAKYIRSIRTSRFNHDGAQR